MKNTISKPMSSRIGVGLLLMVVLATGLVATACDYGIKYRVVNETDETLLTWPSWNDCDELVGNDHDWLDEESVQPRETYHYHHLWGGGLGASGPGCVLIVTKDRRLVMAEPYQYQAVYNVRGPLQAIGDPLPQREDLPEHDWPGLIQHAYQLVVRVSTSPIVAAALAAGFLVAIFITVRFFYRYYVKKAP